MQGFWLHFHQCLLYYLGEAEAWTGPGVDWKDSSYNW
ncbi:hypothetical protein A6R68_24286 [Neotoma lepida]|uniref:Uncharacterized protein n=1 Tax=Neotoma lepida TaxID=56216 RepID=A0A1A6HU11_NEOLE|nr:hypothetical protein A6R68_24286 [Neotoma lepida]